MLSLLVSTTFTSSSAQLNSATSKVLGTYPVTVYDQTPTAPLANPIPSSFEPRYVSGFGIDNTFTVFFEDRDNGYQISYASTTTGPTGLSSPVTPTNVIDTHFVVKNWPINISGTDYAYRAWASVGNNRDHHFYVANDLINWTLVSTFTISNTSSFTTAKGFVYYGFHDVIQINGTYYAFAESSQSQTMIVRSANGDDVWEAFASVGGRPGDGPLELPVGVTNGWTSSGSFVDLGHNQGYGKIYAHPHDSGFYLAINSAAATLSPAELEAAFIDPANWSWHDGSIGPASTPILSATLEHDLRECWVVPSTDPDDDWAIVYTADYGPADGDKALGYATLTPPPPPQCTSHLPLITRNHVVGPDLIVEGIVALPYNIEVIIRNTGTTPTDEDFWVDAYINPSPPPSAVNQIWHDLSSHGLVWGITRTLAAGEAITLTVGEDYYLSEYSYTAWPLSIGTIVYAQVDSYNAQTDYGAVLETHETAGTEYNNILGPIYSLGSSIANGTQRQPGEQE